MTEKEAIELIKTTSLMRYEVISGEQNYLGDAMRMAVQALEEIQKYRAIGLSPELIEAMQGHNIALINQVEEAREKAIDEFVMEIEAEYDNDACPNVTDYLDYKISLRDLFKIAERMKNGEIDTKM